MAGSTSTHEQLLTELTTLRRRVAELEGREQAGPPAAPAGGNGHDQQALESYDRSAALWKVNRQLQAQLEELRRREESVRQQANHDTLTGLPNRILFKDRLSQLLAQAHRNRNQFAVLFLDLDRFKTINDSLGHDAGDRLLQCIAGRLRCCLRESDSICRLGGGRVRRPAPPDDPS